MSKKGIQKRGKGTKAVHYVTPGQGSFFAYCGAGHRHGKDVPNLAWSTDWADVTCKRCLTSTWV